MRKHPNYYDHGLPFSEDLGRNIDGQIARIEGSKASLLIVDGGVGEGKTTLSIEIADYINQKMYGRNINFDKQIGMGGQDFLAKLRTCFREKLPVILYDEAGDFNKRGALSRFNAMLNRTFETYRAFKIIVILILPNFNVLDNDIFDKKIPRFLVHCYGRNSKYGNFKVYSLKRMFYLRKKMKDLTVKPLAYKYERANLNGHFLDLEPARSIELDKFSTKGKIQELKAAEIKMEGLLGYDDMMGKLGCSRSKLMLGIRTLKLKPAKYIERKAYYIKNTIDLLIEHFDNIEAELPAKLRARPKGGRPKSERKPYERKHKYTKQE